MRRMGPPPLAMWILEHLSPGDRDEALSGDLLEDFRTGRSDAWYWRQVLGAVAEAWYRSFRQRAPLLLFAALWSMLAPAWYVVIDRVQSNERIIPSTIRNHWPLASLSWLGMNLVLVWGGILVFDLSLTRLLRITYRKKLRFALAVAPAIFVPALIVTAILMNLFLWPGLAIDRRSLTPVHEMTDVGLWADVLRLPYFVALLGALWKAVPPRAQFSSPAVLMQAEQSSELEPIAVARAFDPYTCKRFFTFMVSAGLLNAMIAGVVLCRLPDSHSPSLTELFVRAVMYVVIGALAGVVGAWFYWQSPASPFRSDPPVPFPEFAVVCASGWIWVPAMVIFSEQVSAAASWVAMIGAYLLAVGLRNATAHVFAPAAAIPYAEETELFAATLYRAPPDGGGYMIALCLFAAGWALATRSNYTAAALLAAAGFLFAWKRTVPRMHGAEWYSDRRRAVQRLVRVAIPAVFITMWALLYGVAHRNRALIDAAFASEEGGAKQHSGTPNKSQPNVNPGGFQSVILWPFPPKKQIIPPIPAPTNYLGLERSRPMVIRFDGAYWYFQPPDKGPGRTAHQAHGTPLGVNIEANNSFPLMMEAHQRLIGPVRLSRCAEIDVEIENRDNVRGMLSMAVLLGDSNQPNGPTLYLGKKDIGTSLPEFWSYKVAPVPETLRFAIPTTAPIRKFDEITVMLLPDFEHAMLGPKIAIEQFQLFPR